MKKNVLVIGGAGYIGSHMVRALIEANYQPVVFDNLSTGHRRAVPSEAIFVKGDLQSTDDVKSLFAQFSFVGVMHFSASSIVPESVQNPLKYYLNNVAAFLNLLQHLILANSPKLILSSTAAVYGEAKVIPIKENSTIQPTHPYGQSKWMMEKILADVAATCKMSYVVFRYFNAAGAHPKSETGECHDPETHLIPNLLNALDQNKKEFSLFGDDYPTPDGTCIRDYIHVQDLCRGHLLALQYLEKGGVSETFNLGSQQGYSVKEILKSVEDVVGKKIPFKVCEKRPGDPPVLVADSQKAKQILGWEPQETLQTIIQTAYQWHEKCHEN